MIEAVIFDLDGTLVDTERLKAYSYARAAVELSGGELTEAEVIEAFKDVVGLSREEVAQGLLKRFNLEDSARSRISEFKVQYPWQVLVELRLPIYMNLIADPAVLRECVFQHNVGLLNYLRRRGFKTGLATMSYCAQANRVLEILELKDKLDFIAARDDVKKGKPDPEIYQLVADRLSVDPSRCLVVEDSLSGVQAALAANMHCIVVTTDFTRAAVHQSSLLDKRWIVDDPVNLESVARQVIENR